MRDLALCIVEREDMRERYWPIFLGGSGQKERRTMVRFGLLAGPVVAVLLVMSTLFTISGICGQDLSVSSR